MNDQTTERDGEPLATPFEVAQLAVVLATMRGHKEPDIFGAIALLKKTALEVAFEKRPKVKPQVHWMSSKTMNPGPGEIIKTPESDPDGWATHLAKLRDFPGAEKIQAPVTYPATLTSLIRALHGGRSLKIKERTKAEKCIEEAHAKMEWMEGIQTEQDFWVWARTVSPSLPKFARLQRKLSAKPPRSRQEGTKGQFASSTQGKDGRFKKKKHTP
jgi:hypothetical protein